MNGAMHLLLSTLGSHLVQTLEGPAYAASVSLCSYVLCSAYRGACSPGVLQHPWLLHSLSPLFWGFLSSEGMDFYGFNGDIPFRPEYLKVSLWLWVSVFDLQQVNPPM